MGVRGGQDDFGNLTSVTRSPRETIAGGAPVSGGVTSPRGTTVGAPVSRVQTGTSRAPQTSPKPAITSAIKKPAVAAKTTTPAAKPAATKTTTALKPATTKTPVAAKTTTKAPAKTTKTPVAAKTTPTKLTTPTKPVKPTGTPITKPVTKPTSTLTSTLKNAAIGAGTAALVNKLAGTKTTGTGTPPFVPPKTTVKPNGIPTAGGIGLKPGTGAPTLKPPTSVVKPPVVPKGSTAAKAATTGATGALTEDQIQAELDRVNAEKETNVVPEGAVTNEDGSYSVTADGMTTTYAADGSIIGMEAVTDTTGTVDTTTGVDTTGVDTTTGLTRSLTGAGGTDTVVSGTGTDTSNMTDLGEGYFADADGNIYGADGNLMYTVGADGEYVDASGTATTADETTWTDPDTGLTWNQGADGSWSQEGFEDVVGDTTVGDGTVVDDEFVDTDLGYVPPVEEEDDGTNYEEDAKGGSIRRKRHFVTGGPTSLGYGDDEGYSDTGEEVQDFQNVNYNYGEENDPTLSGYTLTGNRNPVGNTYLRSALAADDDIVYPPRPSPFSMPEGWPDGYVDNGDGTATYVDDDGSTITIDADTNIVFTTDADGNVFNPERGESVSGTYPNERGESVSGNYPNERGESVSGNYLDERGESVSGNYPVQGITSSGGENKPSFLAQQSDRDESVSGRYDQPYKNQTGILDSLLNAVKENPGLAGGAVGALIASLMDQAGDDSPSRDPVDISELTSFNPRTTDFGAGMVGGRTGTGSPIVSYSDYSEGNGDEIIDDRLYSDLGISGYLREPDMNNYRDEEGNLTDQSGNLVDEYGYLLEDGGYEEEPQEEYMAEEEPTMAGGGTTHYTFGRVMNPAENLGLAEGMKKGGLSQAHTVHSHQTNPVVNNRVDFRKGSAVNGAGDGQSDDIPAWLADGEYVMDAELVSMLGNGSNKAGAKVLDKFREDIRAHKRSAPLGKIPPKAKSPLNYLKESMNG
jgi:DNA-binding protein HU-beta